METPVRYRRPKRIWWLGLPVAGFSAGLLLALSLHLVQSRTHLAYTLQETVCKVPAILGDITPESVPLRADCHRGALWEPMRSSWAATHPALTEGLAFLKTATHHDRLRYPVTTPPPFHQTEAAQRSPSLTQIVDDVVAQLEAQGWPTASVSISLVDLTGDCCTYAGYQDQAPRYPASIVKLFWLVALYGHYDADKLQPEVDVYPDDEDLMVHYSNNGASSRVVDALTQTESGEALEGSELADWISARQTLNDYFLLANYPDLNIAHKTFPVPDLGMASRVGRDAQFADGATAASATKSLTRNYLTTAAAARLLYEIDTGQAISPAWSDRIKQHLHHSTDPAAWQWEDPNAIAGFFGEYLPPDVQLYTKLGFTFDDGRQEAAIIASPEGQTRFILVMFANDSVYSQAETTFPEVARQVYDQMLQRTQTQSPAGRPGHQ